MIEHVFSALCQSASIDRFSNSLSMQNVIDIINVEATEPLQITTPPQGIPFSVHAVSVWFNSGDEEERTTQRIRIVSPSGEQLGMRDESVVVAAKSSHRLIGQITVLPYHGDGVYKFEVCHQKDGEWVDDAKFPFKIEVKVALAEKPPSP